MTPFSVCLKALLAPPLPPLKLAIPQLPDILSVLPTSPSPWLRLSIAWIAALMRTSRFSRDQVRELRYASLLHDFGKVGVREEVLVKAKKLYPAQLEVIKQRFGLVRRTLENESLKSRMDFLLKHGKEQFHAAQKEFDSRLAEKLREIDEYAEAIIWANEPTVLPEGNFEQTAGDCQY